MNYEFGNTIKEELNSNINIVDNRVFLNLDENDKKKFKAFGEYSRILSPTKILNPQNIIIGNYVSIQDNSLINIFRNTVSQVNYIRQHYPEQLNQVNIADYIFGEPLLEIGDGTAIGRFALITCNNKIKVGKRVIISERVYISDNTHRYENLNLPIMLQSQTKGRPIEIGDFSWIGINVVILPGVTIGRHCIVSGNSVVTQDVPDYCMVAGNPARIIKKIDKKATDSISKLVHPNDDQWDFIYNNAKKYLLLTYPQIGTNINGPIFKNGIIDSFGFIDFLIYLEDLCEIELDEMEVITQDLSDLKDVVTFVYYKLNLKGLNNLGLIQDTPSINNGFIRDYNKLKNVEKINIKDWLINNNNPSDTAFEFISHQSVDKLSYSELDIAVSKICNAFSDIGLCSDDTVLVFSERRKEVYLSVIALLILGIKFTVVYEEIGRESLKHCLFDTQSSIVITSESTFNRMKSELLLDNDAKVIVFDNVEHDERTIHYTEIVAKASGFFAAEELQLSKVAFYQYTSGTTGRAKAAVHTFRTLIMQYLTSKYVLDLNKGTKYTCSASLGWITGISYGIIGPLLTGSSIVVPIEKLQPLEWLELLNNYKVEIFYTSPTLIRYCMIAGRDRIAKYELPYLKKIFTIGEPLNNDCIEWGQKVLKKNIYNTWFQTELGAIMIVNNTNSLYSLGKSIPIVDAQIKKINNESILCFKPDFPSFFKGYLNQQDLYKEKFTLDGYYITGDIVERRSDGLLYFSSRSDDIINTAGHLVSPFEIEQSIMNNFEEILEVVVVGKPDNLNYEKVVAFVVLKNEISKESQKKLFQEIRTDIREKVSVFAVPKEIIVLNEVPKTHSGKYLRSELKRM